MRLSLQAIFQRVKSIELAGLWMLKSAADARFFGTFFFCNLYNKKKLKYWGDINIETDSYPLIHNYTIFMYKSVLWENMHMQLMHVN